MINVVRLSFFSPPLSLSMLNAFEEFNVLTDTLRDGWSNDYRAR